MKRLLIAEETRHLIDLLNRTGDDAAIHVCDDTLRAGDLPACDLLPPEHRDALIRCTRPQGHEWLHAAATNPMSAGALWAHDRSTIFNTIGILVFDDPDARVCLRELEAVPGVFLACGRDVDHPPPHMAFDENCYCLAAWQD